MSEIEVTPEDEEEKKLFEAEVRVQFLEILYGLIMLKGNYGEVMISKELLLLMGHKENVTIDIGDRLRPCETKRVGVYFNEFSKQLYKLAEMLTRITVDEEANQIIVIGTDNVMDF